MSVKAKRYKNKYAERPFTIDINTLNIGSVYDEVGFGVGHLPIDRKVFDSWKPIVIAFENEDDKGGFTSSAQRCRSDRPHRHPPQPHLSRTSCRRLGSTAHLRTRAPARLGCS